MIQSTKSLSNVSTNQDKLAQTEQLEATKKIDWNRDQVARLWIETSLRVRTLEKPELIIQVADAMGKSTSAIKTWYYRHLLPYGFEQYWMDKYTAHYRMRIAPKGYSKLHDMIDKERDISKVIEAIDKAEGTQQAPTVQINNFMKTEKNTYGI